jgi:mannose-6-phosphate isomerase-like protein (cupin superfamily)
VDEIWIVTGGRGELWRRNSVRESTLPIDPGVCFTIPAGTDFQFRSQSSEPLVVIGMTMPPWPGLGEAELAQGIWSPTLMPGPH